MSFVSQVEDAIYELVKNLASGRVYVARAPQKVVAPFIIVQETDSLRWRSINNQSGIAQANVQIDTYAETRKEVKKIKAIVEENVVDYRGTINLTVDGQPVAVKIAGVSFQNDVISLDQQDEPFLYKCTASFRVTYHQYT